MAALKFLRGKTAAALPVGKKKTRLKPATLVASGGTPAENAARRKTAAALPGFRGAGAVFGETLAAYDHRLATARVTLREPSDTNGFVNALPMLHHRQMPSIAGGALSLDQVVTMGGVDADLGQSWKGDAELDLWDSEWDQPASLLPVREVIGGFYREVGVTFAGGTLLEDRSQVL